LTAGVKPRGKQKSEGPFIFQTQNLQIRERFPGDKSPARGPEKVNPRKKSALCDPLDPLGVKTPGGVNKESRVLLNFQNAKYPQNPKEGIPGEPNPEWTGKKWI